MLHESYEFTIFSKSYRKNKFISHQCVILRYINDGCKKQHPSLDSSEIGEEMFAFNPINFE